MQLTGSALSGAAELKAARKRGYPLISTVFVFSLFVNALMLTGPIFMMQVYDRVLGSRSEATLVTLFAIVAFLYAIMGVLDFIRGRILARAGQAFQNDLEHRVWHASLDEARRGGSHASADGVRSLGSIARLYQSPLLLALCDIPWTPFFIGAICLFHPTLGLLALAGGSLIVGLTILNQKLSKGVQVEAAKHQASVAQISNSAQAEADTLHGMGMRSAFFKRWQEKSSRADSATIKMKDRSGLFTALIKALRLFLQSSMLAAGAWHVLQGNMTGGAMIASSILMGRALAPIEQSVSQWEVLQRAISGWTNLADLLGRHPAKSVTTQLPTPKGEIRVTELAVVPPGSKAPVLRNVSFFVPSGKALGLIGSSGSGKSSLARALTGIWLPAAGSIRIDGATLDQYDSDALGSILGYLPQRAVLFDGTIAENIARMSPSPDSEAVIKAAKDAGIHEIILRLPKGYDTPVSAGDTLLSGGQVQRVGLARALYDDPALVVLDEPNSNLDEAGSRAVNAAINSVKARNGTVVVIAHRPSIIAACDALLHIEGGRVKAFGPRDDVLRSQVANHAAINAQAGASKSASKDES